MKKQPIKFIEPIKSVKEIKSNFLSSPGGRINRKDLTISDSMLYNTANKKRLL
jgi:hypothetical protein